MQKAYILLILSLFVSLGAFAQTGKGPLRATKVGPLLKDMNGQEIKWHQTPPYNDLCPIVPKTSTSNPNDSVRAYVGCGATSSGQIMKFHRHPAKGTGVFTSYGQTFDLTQFTYNWDLMLPTYTSSTPGTPQQKLEVAQVLRHIGAAMGMIYNENGSGASLNVQREALINYFGYKAPTNIIYRIAYTDYEWFEVIKREIDAGRPVAYSGNGALAGMSGGHLFVCDGYNTSDTTLHFNYGWNGSYNDWVKAENNGFNKGNEALIGLHPTTSDIDPTVAMYTPLNFSDYTPALGKNFDIAVNVANLGKLGFNSDIGVALYKGDTLVKVLQTVTKKLNPTFPTTTGDTKPTTYNLLFQGVSIPTDQSAGDDYQLRLVVKKSATNTWCPALGLVRDVVRVANLKISTDKVASITYPLGSKQFDLELDQALEISVANNRAVANFTVKNTNPEFDFKGDIFLVISPNNEMIPSVWTTIKAEIPTGLTESFSLTDIALPAGVDVDSCRFSVAYSRMLVEFIGPDILENREKACVPMMPAKYNMRKYRIPKETTSFSISFAREGGVTIPADYKKYNPDGTLDSVGYTWSSIYPMGNAVAARALSRLVTTAIDIKDENDVLEWKISNPSTPYNFYRIYVSTEGQDYKYFKDLKPAFEDSLSKTSMARFSLSEYAAAKKVFVMFESVREYMYTDLNYFKILNITSPKDISLQEVNIPGSSLVGESFPVKVSVKNHSAVNVKKVKATYTVEGLPPVTEEISTDIPFNEIRELTFSKPIILTGEPGKQRKIEVRVEQDGEEAEYKSNNDGLTTHMLVDFYPKKNIVLFKSSKLKCGPCGKTYSVIDEVDKMLPEAASGVEVWKDGIYKNTDFTPYATGETPTFFANGNRLSAHGTWDVPNHTNRAYKTMTPPAEVSVTADYEKESSRKLKIKITCRFAAPLKGTYKLGAFIIENNILNTIGEIAGTHPTGERLTKNHMPIATIGGSKGTTADAYQIINPEAKTYVFDCEYTVPEKGFDRNINKDNLQVIGLLFSSTGEILNSGLNSHYIFLPETKGLTFVAKEGGTPFKKIYEVGFVNDTKFISLETHRSTIPTDGKFAFTVTKDASWNGKILRLRVNPDADYNKRTEQFLLPDENGVYTIDKMNMNYYMRVDTADASKPLVDKKGSQLVLSGTWSSADFAAKLDLSSASLTGVDMTGIKIPSGEIPLKAANPNMLIYTADTASVPASWTNVVKGTKADSIALKDGYSFYNSKEFTATTITYTRNYSSTDWTSGCLPFAVSALPADLTAERFANSQDTTVHFEDVTSLEANTPYLLKATVAGIKTFAAANAKVPATAPVEVVKVNYSFNGTFDKMEGVNVNGLYLLNSNGTGFAKANTTDTVSAYRAYIKYTGTNGVSLLAIKHDDANTPNLSQNDSELVMSGTWEPTDFNTKLDLSSDSITGVDMTGIEIPQNAPALNVGNPNMLIYTAADADVPASWTNVVKGTKADSIALKDGSPFRNTKEFTATTITYTRTSSSVITRGYATAARKESICLPFEVLTLPADVTAEEFADSKDSIVSFDIVTSLKANTPYLLNLTGTGDKVFTSAADVLVPLSTPVEVVKGDYSFKGTFDKKDVNGLYKLKQDGSGFEKAGLTDSIPAYRAFIQYNGTNGADSLAIDNSNKPVATPNGSQLVLSGTWALADFARLDLSSDTITGVDMAGIVIPSGDIKLNAANPNMLIYTAENAVVPTSWVNVVKGTNAGSIVLKDGYSFYNSKEFTATTITYTRDYTTQGWESGCLPFAVSTLPAGIVARHFAYSQGTVVSFEVAGSLAANTPYIFNVTGIGKRSFTASNAKVPVTSLGVVTKGDYSFNATFVKMEGADVDGLYLLNPSGTDFKRVDATADIPAYRSFIRYNGTNGASLLTIKQDDGSKPIKNTYGSEMVLSGTWTASDLATLNPLAVSLTGLDMTGITIPNGAPTLTVGNPNMLIFTAADAVVPASWANVVKGANAESIVLQDGYSFNNTSAFTATTITYTRDYTAPGWTSGCLPFALSTLPAGVTAEGLADSRGAILIFEKVSFVEANTPYLFNATGAGKKTFTATNAFVPATIPVKVIRGNYSFHGIFDRIEGTKLTGSYLLSPDGIGFQKANSNRELPAYRAYIKYIGVSGASLLTVRHDDGGTTGVEDVVADRLVIRSFNGTLEITSPRYQQVNIYSLDGRLVRSLMLNEGLNTVYGLDKGFYIVNNQKIVIR